jgi:hypothetical protein
MTAPARSACIVGPIGGGGGHLVDSHLVRGPLPPGMGTPSHSPAEIVHDHEHVFFERLASWVSRLAHLWMADKVEAIGHKVCVVSVRSDG